MQSGAGARIINSSQSASEEKLAQEEEVTGKASQRSHTTLAPDIVHPDTVSRNIKEEREQETDETEEEETERGEGVRDDFRNIILLSENTRRLRNFDIEGREASFRIRRVPEGRNTYA